MASIKTELERELEDGQTIIETVRGARMSTDLARHITRGVQEPKKRAFLLALSQLGNRRKACEAAGISQALTWLWKNEDDNFAARYQECMEIAVDMMEDEVFRRGTEGVLKPVYQSGKLVGCVREYSDALLMFGLRGNKPEKYRDNIKMDLAGTVDIVERLRNARDRANKRKGPKQ